MQPSSDPIPATQMADELSPVNEPSNQSSTRPTTNSTSKDKKTTKCGDNNDVTIQDFPTTLQQPSLASDALEIVTAESAQQASEISKDDVTGGPTTTAEENLVEPPYSTLSEPIKISIILTASFAAIISPISSSIYLPALNSLADDLNVSVTLITLTITTYLVS